MIGQLSLLGRSDASLPLRRRVRVEITETTWVNEVMLREHYLHRKRVRPGLGYAIMLDGEVIGAALFAYPFCPAKTIGGVPRMALIELARFWLRDNVPHLGSCALGRILRRVTQDWHQKFPHLPRPAAVVSWADLEAGHEGILYKAAGAEIQAIGGGNDHHAARTSGRKRHQDYQHKKRRFMWRL